MPGQGVPRPVWLTGAVTPAPDPVSARRALASGVTAYALWGLFPLYWPLLRPAGALEILAHRIAWSFVFVSVALLAVRTPWAWARSVVRRTHLPRLVAASVLIAVNWLTYIWSVNAGLVVEASLGYFINPLVNVGLGVLLFGERLTGGARLGGLLALAGVGVIAWEHASTLWVSLVLAFSFGFYGVAKKRASLPALPGLFVESAILLPAAVGYLAWVHVAGGGELGRTASTTSLLVLSGLVTALPLWLFAIAAPRLPLGVVGMLQYLAPTIQFVLGITVFGQHVSFSYWVGLLCVWTGSMMYLVLTLRSRR